MVWAAKGEDRVKSYRLYRELEEEKNHLLEENARLRDAITVKDDLIRRLAGELANNAKPLVSPGALLLDSYPPQPLSSRVRDTQAPPTAPYSSEDKEADHVAQHDRKKTMKAEEEELEPTPSVRVTGSGTIHGQRPGLYKAVGQPVDDGLSHIITPLRSTKPKSKR